MATDGAPGRAPPGEAPPDPTGGLCRLPTVASSALAAEDPEEWEIQILLVELKTGMYFHMIKIAKINSRPRKFKRAKG